VTGECIGRDVVDRKALHRVYHEPPNSVTPGGRHLFEMMNELSGIRPHLSRFMQYFRISIKTGDER
jgi:hypothetical protein